MEKLTIIIPYYNRIKNLEKLEKVINELDKDKFNIMIYGECPFITGVAQNIMVENIKTNWFMKNDVDVLFSLDTYNYVYEKIQVMTENEYMILGCEYEEQDGSINERFFKCGNEYVVHKNTWSKIGGCSEWGYGYEDYVVAYKLVKNNYPDFTLKDVNEQNVSNCIRDQIVIYENKKHPYGRHLWHEKTIDNSIIQENRKKLWHIVQIF